MGHRLKLKVDDRPNGNIKIREREKVTKKRYH